MTYSDRVGFPGGLYASLVNTNRSVFMLQSLHGFVSDSFMTISSEDFGDSTDGLSTSSSSDGEKDETLEKESEWGHDSGGGGSIRGDSRSSQRGNVSTDSEFSSPFSSGDEEESSPPRASVADDAGYDAGDDVAKRAKKRGVSRVLQACRNRRKSCEVEEQMRQGTATADEHSEVARKLEQAPAIASRKVLRARGPRKGWTPRVVSGGNQERSRGVGVSSSLFSLKKNSQNLRAASYLFGANGSLQPSHAELRHAHQEGCRSSPATHRSWRSAELGTRTGTGDRRAVLPFSPKWAAAPSAKCADAGKSTGKHTSVVEEAGCRVGDAGGMKRDPFAVSDDSPSSAVQGAEPPGLLFTRTHPSSTCGETQAGAHLQLHTLQGSGGAAEPVERVNPQQDEPAVQVNRVHHATGPKPVASIVSKGTLLGRASCRRSSRQKTGRVLRGEQTNLRPSSADPGDIQDDVPDRGGTCEPMEIGEGRAVDGGRPGVQKGSVVRAGAGTRPGDAKTASGEEACVSITPGAFLGLCHAKWSCGARDSPRRSWQGMTGCASFGSEGLLVPDVVVLERICTSPPPCTSYPYQPLQADLPHPRLCNEASELTENCGESAAGSTCRAVDRIQLRWSTVPISPAGSGFPSSPFPADLASLSSLSGKRSSRAVSDRYGSGVRPSTSTETVSLSQSHSGTRATKPHSESSSAPVVGVPSSRELETLAQQRTSFCEGQRSAEGTAIRHRTRRESTRREGRRVFRVRESRKPKQLEALTSFPPFPRRHSVSAFQQRVLLPSCSFRSRHLTDRATASVYEGVQTGGLLETRRRIGQACPGLVSEAKRASSGAQELPRTPSPGRDHPSGLTPGEASGSMFFRERQARLSQNYDNQGGALAAPGLPAHTANSPFQKDRFFTKLPCSCGSCDSPSWRRDIPGVLPGLKVVIPTSSARASNSSGFTTERLDPGTAAAPGSASVGVTGSVFQAEDFRVPISLGSVEADAVLRLGLGLGLGMGMSRVNMHAWSPSCQTPSLSALFQREPRCDCDLRPLRQNEAMGPAEVSRSAGLEVGTSHELRSTSGGSGDVAPFLEWILRQWPRPSRRSAKEFARGATCACRSPANQECAERTPYSRTTSREGHCRRGRSCCAARLDQVEGSHAVTPRQSTGKSSASRWRGPGRCLPDRGEPSGRVDEPGRQNPHKTARDHGFAPVFQPVATECPGCCCSGIKKVSHGGRLAGGRGIQMGSPVSRPSDVAACASELIWSASGLSGHPDGDSCPAGVCPAYDSSGGAWSAEGGFETEAGRTRDLGFEECPDGPDMSSCGPAHSRPGEYISEPGLNVSQSTSFCSDSDHLRGACCRSAASAPSH